MLLTLYPRIQLYRSPYKIQCNSKTGLPIDIIIMLQQCDWEMLKSVNRLSYFEHTTTAA